MEFRPTLRLDKWLWQTRFYKTRTLAADMVSRGKVRVNTRLVKKPAHSVGPGDVLTLAQGRDIRVVRIVAIPVRRGPANEARECFEDFVDGSGLTAP
ncbi:MAG: RNA-binding S4 domain-containing protein [Pseudomonadota bacterium]